MALWMQVLAQVGSTAHTQCSVQSGLCTYNVATVQRGLCCLHTYRGLLHTLHTSALHPDEVRHSTNAKTWLAAEMQHNKSLHWSKPAAVMQ